MGAALLTTIMTFGVVSQNAHDVLYAVTDYLEINGYDADVINNYAQRTHTTINVSETNGGIGANGDKKRYMVTVSFTHSLAWINQDHTLSYSAITKAVDY
ncbi:MAG: hypothetical protein IKF80_04525 [Erysipelotrichaceae bacterium]|nr:hypothetical protein [Erysipelotrichaceae bacterium]